MFFERVVLPPLVDLGYFLKPYLASSMRASLPTLLSTELSPVPRHLTCMCFCNAASTKLHNSEFISFQYVKFCNIFERGEYIKKYFKMSESSYEFPLKYYGITANAVVFHSDTRHFSVWRTETATTESGDKIRKFSKRNIYKLYTNKIIFYFIKHSLH